MVEKSAGSMPAFRSHAMGADDGRHVSIELTSDLLGTVIESDRVTLAASAGETRTSRLGR